MPRAKKSPAEGITAQKAPAKEMKAKKAKSTEGGIIYSFSDLINLKWKRKIRKGDKVTLMLLTFTRF